MNLLYNAVFVIAAAKWGKWEKWKEYYPTILFFIVGDLLYNVLLYNYSMWTFQETIFGQSLLRNHTFISLFHMAILYPATIMLYLGNFPRSKTKKFLWISLWVGIYSVKEFINVHYLQLVNHDNGWNMGWSIAFNIVMFPMLRIHFKNQLLAWGLSIIWIIFLLFMFEVPIDKMK